MDENDELAQICQQTNSKDTKERLQAVSDLDQFIQSEPEYAVRNATLLFIPTSCAFLAHTHITTVLL